MEFRYCSSNWASQIKEGHSAKRSGEHQKMWRAMVYKTLWATYTIWTFTDHLRHLAYVNKVTVRRTLLVLRRMTVCGYIFLVCNQLILLPRVGWEMSDSQGTVTVLCGRGGNRRSGVALPSVHASTCYRLNGTPATLFCMAWHFWPFSQGS